MPVNLQARKRAIANFIGANDGDVPEVAVNTVAPAITGTAQVGETLTVSNGTWTGTPAPSGYAYQWLADDEDIEGATASTYELTEAEVEAVITAEVRAAQPNGYVRAVSNATDAVIAAE